VGGGVPIAARAAAFTADAARNGFGLRFLDGIVWTSLTTLCELHLSPSQIE